jgi:uncharacterized protein HemX
MHSEKEVQPMRDYPPGYQPHYEGMGPERRKKPGSRVYLPSILLIVVLWGGIACGSFYFAKQYIDRSINRVQQTNAINVKALEDRLDTLSTGINDIEQALTNAGLTLSSSDTTQKELNRKIERLDQQLQELEKSLKILKEAPDAVR